MPTESAQCCGSHLPTYLPGTHIFKHSLILYMKGAEASSNFCYIIWIGIDWIDLT